MCAEKHVVGGNRIRVLRDDKRIAISQGGVRIRHEEKPVSDEATATGFVYLLVDCSGSMAGEKIKQARRGALRFVKDARSKGYVTGLIQFESSATHLCDPQRELSVFERRLQEITIGGSTNMTEAIDMATHRLLVRRGLRVIVIATDGMPDNGTSALEAAGQAKKKGIDIIAIGTDDADYAFLKKLASRTGLGVKVSREHFEKGITSAAKSLPLLEGGRPETDHKGG